MKLFRLLSTTAIAIAALAVSASAMTATYTAPTEIAAGSVAISGIEYNKDAEQKTLLILNEDAENVESGHIVQIDQDSAITTVAVGNLTADIDAANNTALETYATALATYETALNAYNALETQTQDDYATVSAAYTTVTAAYADLTAAFTANATDTYYVRVGGAGAVDENQKVLIDACELTVETTVTNTYAEPTAPEEPAPEEPEEPTTPKWHLGNVDLSGNPYETDMEAASYEITVDDAILILHGVDGNVDAFTEEQLENLQILGDVRGVITDYENEYPAVDDALAILNMIDGNITDENTRLVTYYYGEM